MTTTVATMATLSPSRQHRQQQLMVTSPEEMPQQDFEDLMRQRTRIRKEKEEYSVAELRVKVQQLEAGLSGEVKRRVDATTSLRTHVQQRLDALEDKLMETIEARSKELMSKMEELEERMTNLEVLALEERPASELASVESKATQMQSTLQNVQQELEVERKSRLIREGRFLAQLEQHEQTLKEQWETEQTARIEAITELQHMVSQQETMRQSQSTAWQHQVELAIQELQDDLETEVKMRQTEDDEIIRALHQTNQQFRHSLNILNGEEDDDGENDDGYDYR